MLNPIEIITLLLLLVASAFFSASETALISVSHIKVKLFLTKEKKGSLQLKRLKDKPHSMITSLLICNTIVNITASVFATVIAFKVFNNNPVAYATGIMTFLILLFGEVVPKNFAAVYAEKLSLIVAPPVYILTLVLAPIVFIFDFITIKVFHLRPLRQRVTEEEVRSIVDIAREDGGIAKEEKELIHRIFKFDDIDVDAIKVPRKDMVTIKIDDTIEEVLEIQKRHQHSRFPVYDRNKDRILGIFYFKDALHHIKRKDFDVSISSLMREPLFIPETKKIDDMLKLFQKKKQHMAIIIDEHGDISGLVTMEDILEEIVGEIADETENVPQEIEKIDENSYKVLAKAGIEKINRKLKINLKTGNNYDTFSGYILDKLGKIPKEGEEYEFDSCKIKINKVEENRIIEVWVGKK